MVINVTKVSINDLCYLGSKPVQLIHDAGNHAQKNGYPQIFFSAILLVYVALTYVRIW